LTLRNEQHYSGHSGRFDLGGLAKMSPSAIFLLQSVIILAVPVVLLRISGLKGVIPLVTVQIFVGIALGPTVFGKISPEYFHLFAGPAVLAPLGGLATLAVLIFGLLTGLHLDHTTFIGKGPAFWALALVNIVAPMTLGCLAGYWLLARYPDELLPGVTSAEFIAAIGIIVSMKALPVLGAILVELELLGSRIANLALGVAGLNDVLLWILISILLAAKAGGAHQTATYGLPPTLLIVAVPAYLMAMVWYVRPALGRLVDARMVAGEVSTRAALVLGVATAASALTTELMGLHYIIGAFLVGAILPDILRKPVVDRLQVVTVALMLPFFFALTGMRTMIDLSSPAWLEIFAVATSVSALGIIGGTATTAALFGETWSFGLGLGCLLQAKGLTELIVLTVLLDSGLVSPRIFAAMVLMALFSTAFAMPLARLALSRPAARPAPARDPVASG
jgi:Kef-type K+ transport system membrane component KefB